VLLSHYEANRSELMAGLAADSIDPDEIARCLPAIASRDRVWQLIERAVYLNGGTWKHPSMAFECIFDIEHELHISFTNGRVADVWNE
jgi:hypothetical protein